MALGPAIWLRLMPTFDPGKKWETYELEQHAIRTGSLNLPPFAISSLFKLRAHDGVGICSLVTSNDNETMSAAFAFETGEIWGIDTTLLHYGQNVIPFLEPNYTECLQGYARFLSSLGLQPPYHWIGGITGVKGRRLLVPVQQGYSRVPGWSGPQCLADTIVEEGTYDGEQTPTDALYPLFKAIFAKSGIPRPDYLPR